ncbi:hypothetical protein CBW65_23860 [Tumebacillus avium]|uniref:RsgI N-terminal anti-sigma domain-containing protein n=1 Tax=Tumebacillus avium TaxID=1903704 RepID=A0A1Y0IUU7_9BACL|nr:anti-sigma factor domain-containing protein [Tumebacillus avium]ARU63719.1 hypothetical protein CBW65_23860 [Tumebacillus avium]
MQNKGIVMQVANGKVIVMTKDRRFLNVPWADGMTVGQEIDVPDEVLTQTAGTGKAVPLPWYKKSWNTTWKKTGVIAASVLLAVSVWTSTSLFSEPVAYAYVTVDINPSIELSIDNHKQVVTAVPLNDEGGLVLKGLALTGLSVEAAVGKLAEIARTQGYLDEKTEVIITASPAAADDEQKADLDLNQVESDLVAQVETLAQNTGAEVEVEGIVVSREVRDAAQDAGLSPGKYALYVAAVQSGIEVEIDEFKHESISKIVDKRGQELADVLHGLKGGQELDDWHRDMNEKQAAEKQQGKGKVEQGVVPGNSGNREQEKKTPPGQQKKEDGKQNNGKDDKKGSEQGPSQKDKPSEREQDTKKVSPQSSKSSDDKENDRQKGKDRDVKQNYGHGNQNKEKQTGKDKKDD